MKIQYEGRPALLELFEAVRRGLANLIWEAGHVNGTGFAATTHVRQYERATRCQGIRTTFPVVLRPSNRL
jgi:hypothetical protein